jgi:hypothetical protein
MDLTLDNVFKFINIPSESENGIHFKFDYPATHTVISFEIEDLKGNFVNFDGEYNAESEIISKVVSGESVLYKRLQTMGKFLGAGLTYRIILSKGLDE